MSPRDAILVASPLDDALVSRIRAAAADRYDVLWRRDLYPTDYDPSDPGFASCPLRWSAEQQRWWDDAIGRAAVVFDQVWLPDPQVLVDSAPALRWLQCSIAGVGGSEVARLAAGRVQLTTAAGVHADPLAEHVLGSLLYLRRNLAQVAEHRRRQLWQRVPFEELAGSRTLIVGLGRIGTRIARVLAALDVEVLAAVRRLRDDTDTQQILLDQVDDLLPTVDVVVLCCALAEETRGLLSKRRIGLLADHAIVVNVGRGALVDEAALVDALATGRLAGAVLDTVVTEPLPADHPLWNFENVVLTSHSASASQRENERLVDLFVRNLQRFDSGLPLENAFKPTR